MCSLRLWHTVRAHLAKNGTLPCDASCADLTKLQHEATPLPDVLLAWLQCLRLLLCLLLLGPGLQHGFKLVLGAGLHMLKEVLGSHIIHNEASHIGIVQQRLPDRTALHSMGRGVRTPPPGARRDKAGMWRWPPSAALLQL